MTPEPQHGTASLRAWVPARNLRSRDPFVCAIGRALERAFPPICDEPSERLMAALLALEEKSEALSNSLHQERIRKTR
jgi:hypothetical protein